MKNAIIIGGSNGVGLSISKDLVTKNYHAIILDKVAPAEKLNDSFTYIPCNLLKPNEDLYNRLAADTSCDMLVITAGYGHITDFENMHISEIQNILQVNAVSIMKIIKHFYHRIKSPQSFHTAIMCSIAGLVNSPLFAVYSASKAALCRFIESVNTELEAQGFDNRILNVSPGSISGTRFNGGNNDTSLTRKIASDINDAAIRKETLLIPDYDTVYKNVLERYHSDPRKFGLESYAYKMNSGRMKNKRSVVIGYLSGTFDLFHVGHLNLLRRAKDKCDYLIVGVHPDGSHKGKTTFIPFEERLAVVGGCKYVDKVVRSCQEDSDAWKIHKFDKLFVGSDYKGSERFAKYESFFADKNVEIIYFDYTQSTNSTKIRNNIVQATINNTDKKE